MGRAAYQNFLTSTKTVRNPAAAVLANNGGIVAVLSVERIAQPRQEKLRDLRRTETATRDEIGALHCGRYVLRRGEIHRCGGGGAGHRYGFWAATGAFRDDGIRRRQSQSFRADRRNGVGGGRSVGVTGRTGNDNSFTDLVAIGDPASGIRAHQGARRSRQRGGEIKRYCRGDHPGGGERHRCRNIRVVHNSAGGFRIGTAGQGNEIDRAVRIKMRRRERIAAGGIAVDHRIGGRDLVKNIVRRRADGADEHDAARIPAALLRVGFIDIKRNPTIVLNMDKIRLGLRQQRRQAIRQQAGDRNHGDRLACRGAIKYRLSVAQSRVRRQQNRIDFLERCRIVQTDQRFRIGLDKLRTQILNGG